MAKKKYTVQTPVRHDGEDYAPGATIELDIPEDHPLLVDGVIAGGKAVKAAKTNEAAEAEAAAAAQAALEAEAAAAAAAVAAAAAGEGQGA